jgi:histidinol-phosphate aminotransferase
MPKVRPDLALFGGYHSPQVQVEVRLNTNESPFSPPPEFMEDLFGSLSSADLNRYPDRTAKELRTALAALHGVTSEQIFIGNGSNEVISTLLLAYGGPGRKAMTFEPTYAMYSQIARITSTEVIEVERDSEFALGLDEVVSVQEATRPEVVFFCSPNNPTGLGEDPEIISAVAQDENTLVVIDEAYGQFASFSALKLAQNRSNIVVSKTFSKVWSLAGVRLGYLIGPEDIVANLWDVCLPYHIDTIKQLAGRLSLERVNDMEGTLDRILAGRDEIEGALKRLDLKYWPSSANFILFRGPDGLGDRLWQALVDRSVLVRNCSGWPRLNDCLRVTVGTEEENARFITALSESLAELRS